jgi:hypothetical protein
LADRCTFNCNHSTARDEVAAERLFLAEAIGFCRPKPEVRIAKFTAAKQPVAPV